MKFLDHHKQEIKMITKGWKEVSFALFLLVLWSHFQGVQMVKGRSFLLVFPKNDGATPRILLTATDVTTVHVTVTTNLEQSSYAIGGQNPTSMSVRFSTNLLMTDSHKYNNSSVRVEADADILVHAYTAVRGLTRISSASFLVFPLRHLSTYHVALTYCPSRFCLIAVASPYNNTKVELTLKSETNDSEVLFGGETFSIGDVIQETLQENESLQVAVRKVDLTGSVIESDKPVVVISGGDFVRLKGSRKDSMLEMIPSVEDLGQEFVIPAFPGQLNGTWVFVVFTHPNTTLVYDPKVLALSDQNPNRYIFHLAAHTIATLSASHKVLVGSSAPSTQAGFYYDPSMVLVMPTTVWTHQYTVPFIMVAMTEKRYSQSVLILFTTENCNGPFFVDDLDITPNLFWTKTSPFKSSYLLFVARRAFTLYSSNCTFGGYLAETAVTLALSVPLGWSFQDIQPETDNASHTTDGSSEAVLTSESNAISGFSSSSHLVIDYKTNFFRSTLRSSTSFLPITAEGSAVDPWSVLSHVMSSTLYTSIATTVIDFDPLSTTTVSIPTTLHSRMTSTTTIPDRLVQSYLDLASSIISLPSLQSVTIQYNLPSDTTPGNEFILSDTSSSPITSKPRWSSFDQTPIMTLSRETGFHHTDSDFFPTFSASITSTLFEPPSILERSGESRLTPFVKSKPGDAFLRSSTEIYDSHSGCTATGFNSDSETDLARPTIHIHQKSSKSFLTSSHNSYSLVHQLHPTPNTLFDQTTADEPLISLSFSQPSFSIRWTTTPERGGTFEIVETSYDQSSILSDYASLQNHSDSSLSPLLPLSTSHVTSIDATVLPYGRKSTPSPKPKEANPTELKLCPCKCNERSMNVSTPQSKEEQSKILTAIVNGLTVNRSQLSSSVRKKTSILILEPTSTVIGSAMAVSVMAVVSGFIIIPDIMAMSSFLYKTSKRLF